VAFPAWILSFLHSFWAISSFVQESSQVVTLFVDYTQINTHDIFCDHSWTCAHTGRENFNSLECAFSAEVEWSDSDTTFFCQLPDCKQVSFSLSKKCDVFHTFVLFMLCLWISCLKWLPNTVLYCCLLFLTKKSKKAVMCTVEKICALDKIHSGTDYS
jgi:hypothetical protein